MITLKRARWFFLILVFGLFATPYLVNLDMIRTRVENKTSGALGIRSHIGGLSWQWFPSPGLILEDVTLDHTLGHAQVAEAVLHPQLGPLFKGSLVIKAIRIIEPDIRISSLDSLKNVTTPDEKDNSNPRLLFYPGHISVSVSRGRLSAPWSGSWESLNRKAPPPELSHITLAMDIRNNTLSLEGRMASSHSDTLSLALDLRIDDAETMHWNLNMEAQSTPFGPLRSVLLHVFPEDQVVQNIFGTMIPDGHIKTGSFRFTGKTHQWRDIKRMEAMAQVEHVDFRIPGTALTLKNTTGVLNLSKGILSGQNLTTQFGASTGNNGSFALDLGKNENTPFSLAMDLSADLSDLPPVLDTFLPESDIKKELAALRDLKGNAHGQLTLSGDLSQLSYGLDVQDISASCFVPRVRQPVTIVKGELSVSPSTLAWNSLAADVGQQHIHNSSGRLDWKGSPALDITSLSATVDSEELFPYLASDSSLGPRLKPWVSSVSGLLDIRSLSVKGPFNNPASWTINGQLSTMGATLVCPPLHHPLTLISPGVRFTENSLATRTLTARMGKQMIRIKASWEPGLTHADLYGTLNASSESWLRENGWIPDAVFPRLPCDLDPLSLTWSEGELAVKGLIIHRDAEKLPMTTRLEMTVQDSVTLIRDLSIDDGKQNALITARIPSDLQSGEIHATLEGAVSSSSLTRIITNTRLPKGDISGQATLVYPLDNAKPPRLTGNLHITRLEIDNRDKSGLTLSRGHVSGQDERISFDLQGLGLIRPQASPTHFQALAGDLVLLPGSKADVTLSSGNICGIGLSGDILLPSLSMDMRFNVSPKEKLSLKTLSQCLGIKGTAITGHVSCDASIQGTPDMINQGRVSIHAKDGIIEKGALFSKILALLDLTELFKANSVKNLLTEGYRYDSLDIDATITGHNMHITRSKIIGAGINFYATGYVDLKNRSLDLYVLASPFKTVDNLVTRIPVIGKVVGGKNRSVLSVPVKVEGHMDNPQTRILPKTLSDASSSIRDAFVSTFKLPFELSYEVMSGNRDTRSESEKNTK